MTSRYRHMPHASMSARDWFDWLLEELARGVRVHVHGFGTFSRATRKARRIRNPVTKQLMTLSETTTVKFTAAKAAKERIK